MICRITVNMKTHKIGACNTIYVTSNSHLLSTHRKEGGKLASFPSGEGLGSLLRHGPESMVNLLQEH